MTFTFLTDEILHGVLQLGISMIQMVGILKLKEMVDCILLAQ